MIKKDLTITLNCALYTKSQRRLTIMIILGGINVIQDSGP